MLIMPLLNMFYNNSILGYLPTSVNVGPFTEKLNSTSHTNEHTFHTNIDNHFLRRFQQVSIDAEPIFPTHIDISQTNHRVNQACQYS